MKTLSRYFKWLLCQVIIIKQLNIICYYCWFYEVYSKVLHRGFIINLGDNNPRRYLSKMFKIWWGNIVTLRLCWGYTDAFLRAHPCKQFKIIVLHELPPCAHCPSSVNHQLKSEQSFPHQSHYHIKTLAISNVCFINPMGIGLPCLVYLSLANFLRLTNLLLF